MASEMMWMDMAFYMGLYSGPYYLSPYERSMSIGHVRNVDRSLCGRRSQETLGLLSSHTKYGVGRIFFWRPVDIHLLFRDRPSS